MPSLTPRLDKIDAGDNKIIGGNMDFWQRGTSFAAIATGAYAADRWQFRKNGASTIVHTVSRSTDVPTLAQSGFQSVYSYLATVTTNQATLAASDLVRVIHSIEGSDYAALHGQNGRLQFWVKSSIAGTYSVSFANGGATRAYAATYTINAANTWEKKAIDLQFDSSGTWAFDNTMGVGITFIVAAGTNFQTSTLNTWQSSGSAIAATTQTNGVATNGATFQIAQVSLVQGSFASTADLPFKRAGKTIGDELRMCQRYFEKSYDVGVNPGTGTSSSTAIFLMQAQAALSAGYALPWVFFKTSKRTTTPVVTVYGTGGTINNITLGGTGDVAGAVGELNQNGFYANRTATSLINATLYTHFTAESEL